MVWSKAFLRIRTFSDYSSNSSSKTRNLALKVFGYAGLGVAVVFGAAYAKDSRAAIYPYVIMPILHLIDPEDSHYLSIKMASLGLAPRDTSKVLDARLKVDIWNKVIENPIGLAAGYDKNGQAIDALMEMGFGCVEIGSITPLEQAGNPRPRFFRLEKDQAVINRYGFNSQGHDAVYSRLSERHEKAVDDQNDQNDHGSKLVGINLGKNKSSAGPDHSDYLEGIKKFAHLADYLVINISSPNTPGLRTLQSLDPIKSLLTAAKKTRNKQDALHNKKTPLLVKIAPDCSDQELADIATVVMQVGIDGVIISNTTVSRPNTLKADGKTTSQFGGLSGKPLKPLALAAVTKFYTLTGGKMPIVGCGGISNGKDAVEFAKAGASIVQLYTALGYSGPGLVREIKEQVADILAKEGKTWMETIGANHSK